MRFDDIERLTLAECRQALALAEVNYRGLHPSAQKELEVRVRAIQARILRLVRQEVRDSLTRGLAGRRRASSAARAFGVSDEDLDAIRAMEGATWAEGEYPDDPFRGLKK